MAGITRGAFLHSGSWAWSGAVVPRLAGACVAFAGLLGPAYGQGKAVPEEGRTMPPQRTDLLSVAQKADNPGGLPNPVPTRDHRCRHPGPYTSAYSGAAYNTDQEEFTFTLATTRYIGPVHSGLSGPDTWRNGTLLNAREMVAAGTLGNTARVEIEFYLHNNECSHFGFPVLEIEFNGQSVNAALQTTPTYPGEMPDPGSPGGQGAGGSNGGERRQSVLLTRAQWTKDKWQKAVLFVPIDLVRFPAGKGSGSSPPTPAENTLTIKWDARDTSTICYCMTVNWASMKVRAMAPVVLMHGINQTDAWWSRHGFSQYLDVKHIPYEVLDLKGIGAPVPEFNAQNLWVVARPLRLHIEKLYAKWGASQLHFVAHSKGGLHVRNLLATDWANLKIESAAVGGIPNATPVPSFTTLCTPHNGSVLADIMFTGIAYQAGSVDELYWGPEVGHAVDLSSRYSAVSPGYETLQTPFCTGLNARHFGGLGGQGGLPPAQDIRYHSTAPTWTRTTTTASRWAVHRTRMR